MKYLIKIREMNLQEIKKLVKHKDYTTAYEQGKRQDIHVPNPFNMMSNSVLNHLIHFDEWEQSWKRSGYSEEFTIEINDKKRIVITSNCPRFKKAKDDYNNSFRATHSWK